MAEQPWLAVVDPQRIFADPDSPWAAPRFAEIVAPIHHLAMALPERTVVTRWVPGQDRTGSWAGYFEHFPFADRPDDDPMFALVREAEGLTHRPTVNAPTFGKWGDDLEAITGPTPHLILTGVSTDCCVISTALPAVDAGCQVTVVSDGCAGSSVENHAAALQVMGLYTPQLAVRTSAEVLAEL